MVPNGPASADKAESPPAASAGKNLNRSRPRSRPRMMSPAVAIPGRNGIAASRAASARGSVKPGETMNRAPASTAWLSCVASSTVPAPTIAPGTAAIARTASSADGVRRVTSITGRPASTKVSASAMGSIDPSSTSTGMTGAAAMISSIVIDGPSRMLQRRHTGRAGGGSAISPGSLPSAVRSGPWQ